MADAENEKKPDNAEINQELFQQSAELKKKSIETNKNLEDLKRRTQELLHPDHEKNI
ncbi:MAG: hypothetical protein V4594_20370 [Bacteroidota bacterium]